MAWERYDYWRSHPELRRDQDYSPRSMGSGYYGDDPDPPPDEWLIANGYLDPGHPIPLPDISPPGPPDLSGPAVAGASEEFREFLWDTMFGDMDDGTDATGMEAGDHAPAEGGPAA